MDFPDLSKLPPWAAVIFVVCLAVIYVVSRTGWLQGLKSTPSTHQAEVAAVIVDPKALNEASASADRLTAQVGKLCDLLAQIIADTREERDAEEKEAIWRAGWDASEAKRRPVRRRAVKSG